MTYRSKQDYEFPEDETEEIDLEEEENYQPKHSAKRHLTKRGIAVVVALALATGGTATYFGYKGIMDKRDYDRAARLTGSFQTENVSVIPERIFTSQNHDFTFTSGKHLTEAAENQRIDILRIGDYFITPTGDRIAVLTLEIETVHYLPIQRYEVNGQEFYIEPNGYTWNYQTQRCEMITTEVIEKITYANDTHDYSNLYIPGSRVKEVISYAEYDSITYEQAGELKLIADVNDDYVNNNGSYSTEAALRLVPNNQK